MAGSYTFRGAHQTSYFVHGNVFNQRERELLFNSSSWQIQ